MIEVIKYVILIFLLDQFVSIVRKKSDVKWKKQMLVGTFVLLFGGFYGVVTRQISENYYETFSLNRIFSPEMLKKSFWKLSMDPENGEVNPVFEEKKFQEIKFQYEILANEDNRLVYDKFGPEIISMIQNEDKKVDAMSLFYTYRMRFLIKDGVFYFTLGIVLAAISSENTLGGYQKICYVLILSFYILEVLFLWPERQEYDIFDYLLPKFAIWERIYLLKNSIGLICLSLKTLLRSKLHQSEYYIIRNLKRIRNLQEESKAQIDTVENNNFDLKERVGELNKLIRETADICENKNPNIKQRIEKKRQRRIKSSLVILIGFLWIYHSMRE